MGFRDGVEDQSKMLSVCKMCIFVNAFKYELWVLRQENKDEIAK